MIVVKTTLSIFLTTSILFVNNVHSKFEFTNVECTELDRDFMTMDECVLKSINRTYKYMNIRTRFNQFPVDRIIIKVEVLKRLNGYHPFLFNFTVDACKFLNGQKKTKVTQFFYDLFAPYSNIIHKCPYDQNIFVSKLPISHLDNMLSNVLPVPEGVYCVHSIYFTHGIPRMDLKVYVKIY